VALQSLRSLLSGKPHSFVKHLFTLSALRRAWSRIRRKKQTPATSPSNGSSPVQPASMIETQNVASTTATHTVSYTGQRPLVST
jgi:hypothetical protein